MDLYFSPLACSMSSRIALYEAGAAADFIEVDAETKRTRDGADYLAVNPLGLVPALRTDEGDMLLENQAILQYIADRFGDGRLAPRGGLERARLQQWLSFTAAELHKGLFVPLFDRKMPEEAKALVLATGERRLAYLDGYLRDREFLLDRFSVADAYLVTVLNWNLATPVELAKWPAIDAYCKRLKAHPSVARALAEESALYAEELKRRRAG